MKIRSFRTRPAAEIYIAEENESVRRRFLCRDGVDIHYRPEVLLKFFFRPPTPQILDVLRIVASIAHADRRIPRRHSVCWGRDIELDIPVSDPEFWHNTASKLRAVAELVTGDFWSFQFRKLSNEIELPTEGYLAFPPNEDLATAYSNGLDSFAVARLVASGHVRLSTGDASKKNLVLVTTGQKIYLSDTYSQFGYRVRQISVPFSVPQLGKNFQLREASYRSRALVFQTIAALASVQSQSNTVIVGEAGQGSLGPWLTLTGEEAPDLRTHPLFTRQLSDFLKAALDVEVKFEHPLIWNTKGESLRNLVSANLQAGWEETHSCAVQARHQKTKGGRVHCGLCPNCLLRRQSLLAAGLDDPDSNYDYGSAVTQDSSTQKRAAQGLMPLIELACINDEKLPSRVADRQIRALGNNLKLEETETRRRVSRLIDVHKNELKQFVAARPVRSLLRRFGEVLL